jgi:hypothetical protein
MGPLHGRRARIINPREKKIMEENLFKDLTFFKKTVASPSTFFPHIALERQFTILKRVLNLPSS